MGQDTLNKKKSTINNPEPSNWSVYPVALYRKKSQTQTGAQSSNTLVLFLSHTAKARDPAGPRQVTLHWVTCSNSRSLTALLEMTAYVILLHIDSNGLPVLLLSITHVFTKQVSS